MNTNVRSGAVKSDGDRREFRMRERFGSGTWPRIGLMVGGWAAGFATATSIHVIAGIGFAVLTLLIHNIVYRHLLPLHFLTLYVVVQLLVSTRYVIKPIGALGYPASLIGLVSAGWWLISRIVPKMASAPGPQPVRTIALVYVAISILGFGVAYARPIESLEANGTVRVLLGIVWQSGLALLAADGLRRYRDIRRLLEHMVNAGAVFALLGIVEYLTGKNWSDTIKPPGLQANSLYRQGAEFGVRRVLGAALHPIEFGVVLAMLLPLALHFALYDTARPSVRNWPWIRLTLIGVAIPMSVSRSAVLGLFAVCIMIFPVWPKTWRSKAFRYGPIGLLATRGVFPGLLGTIFSQFTNLLGDPSISGRTQDYSITNGLIAKAPLWGRGLGTFLPEKYFYLDNQFLGTLIEQGVIGVVVLSLLLIVGLSSARGARHRTFDPEKRHMAQAVAAAIAVQIPAMLTFDALSFPTNAGILFLLIGVAGALWRVEALGEGQEWVWPYKVPVTLAPRLALKRDSVLENSLRAGSALGQSDLVLAPDKRANHVS